MIRSDTVANGRRLVAHRCRPAETVSTNISDRSKAERNAYGWVRVGVLALRLITEQNVVRVGQGRVGTRVDDGSGAR